MATKPKIVTLTNSSVDVLNAIRNSATTNYRDYVPVATADAESIREIGSVIMDNPSLQNEFLSALVNRIGRVILTSKLFENPWAVFKKGMLDFGETIEEIFVDIAKPYEYDPAVAEEKVFKRETPDVKSAFHVLNYQKYYKATIQENDLQKAFLSWSGVSELISKIVDAMYTGANYDEFLTMKYLLAKHILDGHLYATKGDIDPLTMCAHIKAISNSLEFPSRKYNMTGVQNFTKKPQQYLIMSAEWDAQIDVGALASAFNMDKAQFMGNRILVDGFGNLDTERLNELFADDPNYVPLTDEQIKTLNDVPCVLVDENFFMIYDILFKFTEQYNGEGIYWNYWYHTWKAFSVSPFANAVVFTLTSSGIKAVSVSPTTANVAVGQSVSLTATVETEGFASKAVNWTSSDGKVATVNRAGMVTAVAKGTVTITATSAYDSTKKATATLTIA